MYTTMERAQNQHFARTLVQVHGCPIPSHLYTNYTMMPYTPIMAMRSEYPALWSEMTNIHLVWVYYGSRVH